MKLSDTSRRPPLASTEEDWLNTSRRCGAVPFQIAPPDISAKGSASNKYPASPDACTSCRTVTGCEITSWAFVSRDRLRTSIHGAGKISDSQGNTQRPLNLLDMSALTYYKNLPSCDVRILLDVWRERLLLSPPREGGEEDTIDIAAGLLESRVGVRAEDWLVWDHYGDDVVAYREDGCICKS
jgi:hypothetical protein